MSRYEAWIEILGGENGLAEMQSELLDHIRINEIPYKKLKALTNSFRRHLTEGDKVSETAKRVKHSEYDPIGRINFSREARSTFRFSDDFSLDFYPSPDETYAEDLFQAAAVLVELYAEAMSSFYFDKYTKDDKDDDLTGVYTELETKERITLDNLQTLLDVLRCMSYGEKDIKARHNLIDIVCSERFKERVVRENETILEIAARAPFSFWAISRRKIPTHYRGESIRDGLKYNYDYLKHIATGKVKDPEGNAYISDVYERNGGCPALNRRFDDSDIIYRLGQQFVDLHRRLYIDKA